jgi:hypothetical protein
MILQKTDRRLQMPHRIAQFGDPKEFMSQINIILGGLKHRIISIDGEKFEISWSENAGYVLKRSLPGYVEAWVYCFGNGGIQQKAIASDVDGSRIVPPHSYPRKWEQYLSQLKHK